MTDPETNTTNSSEPDTSNMRDNAQQFSRDARDEALSAAEKGLEAARAALEAAEKKLAEAQRAASVDRAQQTSSSTDNIIEVDPVEATTDGSTSSDTNQTQTPQTQPSASYQHSDAQQYAQQYDTAQESQPQQPYVTQSQPYSASQQFQAQQTYAAPQQPQQPGSSYYQAPSQSAYTVTSATKDHVAAGLLAIFFGGFGIHKFYLGYSTQGFIMLAVSILGGLFSFGLVTCIVWLIGVIEGIIYLTKSQADFEQMYVHSKREWF